MTFQQFLIIIRARYGVILLSLLTCVAVAVGLSLWLPKQYTATTSVVIDMRPGDTVTGAMLQSAAGPSYMSTQVDIITSDRVALGVVKRLGLLDSPAIRAQWAQATEGGGNNGELIDWLSALLKKKLEIKPSASRDSSVITIAYTATEPEFAAAVANAFAQVYIDLNLELRVSPARQFASFFEGQTQAARDRLEAAQKALSEYQQANGITSVDERLDFEVAKLNETSSQLTALQGQTTDSESKRGNAKSDTLAEVMQNPLVNSLKADITRLEAKMKESNVNLGVNHPQTQRTIAELATLRSELEAETRKITSAIETTYQVSKQRESQLKGAVAAQKSRVLMLNKQRDELNVLKRDIETAQQSFELVSQRASQTGIESRSDQTNIAVLTPAVTPSTHSSPRLVLNTAAGIVLGLLLGVGLALALELANRRVRSVEDLAEALGLPVLGTIAKTGVRA